MVRHGTNPFSLSWRRGRSKTTITLSFIMDNGPCVNRKTNFRLIKHTGCPSRGLVVLDISSFTLFMYFMDFHQDSSWSHRQVHLTWFSGSLVVSMVFLPLTAGELKVSPVVRVDMYRGDHNRQRKKIKPVETMSFLKKFQVRGPHGRLYSSPKD